MPSFIRDQDGSLPAYAWPGGYPVFYLCAGGGILCPRCANDHAHLDDPDDPQWHVVGQDINWEDPDLFCDHCGARIPSAYAEEDIP